jgi:hypothetical protein
VWLDSGLDWKMLNLDTGLLSLKMDIELSHILGKSLSFGISKWESL